MERLHFVLAAMATLLVMPALAVESVYLDSVPVTNPGQYLAPANLYFQVPPPSASANTVGSLVPATMYEIGIVSSTGGLSVGSSSNTGYTAYAPPSTSERNAADGKIRVLLKPGLDNASDVPLTVMREHLAGSDVVDLVDEGEIHDVMVEVETMKLASSPTVFIVINAYKDVDGQSLIFYNNFGYMGDLKLQSSSSGYASQLEYALTAEAERLQD